jgi:RimJ/RimL family protein N-acetyltransferase
MDANRDLVPEWSTRPLPSLPSKAGRTVVIERFDAVAHGPALFEAIGRPERHDLWEFIPMGPFDDVESFTAFFSAMHASGAWHVYVFRRPGDAQLLGTASLMNVRADAGVAEVGCVIYGPDLKRTTAATELQYLLAHHVFEDLGYRRHEWKCNAANAPSRRAAERLGFRFEGVFRKHMVVRGRNRDTAWFSITDDEWPRVRAGFETWLAAGNFDANRTPKHSLESLRAAVSAE